MSGQRGLFCYLFPLINLVRLSSAHWTMLKCPRSTGDDALCRGGQRQRIPSEWKASSGEEDTMGNRWRWVMWPLFSKTVLPRNTFMILCMWDITFDCVRLICCSWKSQPLWVCSAEGFPDQVNCKFANWLVIEIIFIRIGIISPF